jgi:hypothetical protein
MGYNIDTINKNSGTFMGASKEVGLEIIVEETKCMLLSHHHKTGQKSDLKIANSSSENLSHFVYWRTKLTYKNLIQK